MAEGTSAGFKGTVAGWIKAGVTSIVGLLSGAFLMYLTPVINNTIKPAKPLSNFATQITGLTATFNNHSNGGAQGWWDFGDGSALIAYSPKDATISHTYAKPGTYNVKLSLQNLIGEESERTVAINVDGSNAATTPELSAFELTPITPGERAPAVYRLQSKIKNAAFTVLCAGDDRPMQVDVDSTNLERYLTFSEMGSYTIRLAAINGKEIAEKKQTVYVSPNDGLEPMAKLTVSYEAVRVKHAEKRISIPCVWNRDPKERVCPFREERIVEPGFVIIGKGEIVNKGDPNAPVRNLKLDISPDKTRYILTGELVKSTAWLPSKTTPSWQADIKIALEKRSPPIVINRGDVMMAANLNSTVRLPIQPLGESWEILRKQINLEVWDGPRKAWEGNQAVANARVTLKGQPCYLTLMPHPDSMTLKIDAPNAPAATPSVVRPVSFERLPLLPRPK